MDGRSIIILVPTREEAAALDGRVPSSAGIIVSGIGMAETGAYAAIMLGRHHPSLMVLAGIAGAYPDSGLSPGDCVSVYSETIADMGAMREDTFRPLFARQYECPAATTLTSLPLVKGFTVNCCGFAGNGNPKGIENMEGAAFFAVCAGAGVDFLEVRAVSNLTTDKRGDWKIDDALAALPGAVTAIIGEWDQNRER